MYNRIMDIIYHLQGSEYVWDKDKAQINIRKHGITFEEAAEVFFDPFYQTGDASVDDSEQRDFIVGYTFYHHLLLVVYTERSLQTRIISARPATRAERKAYEEN